VFFLNDSSPHHWPIVRRSPNARGPTASGRCASSMTSSSTREASRSSTETSSSGNFRSQSTFCLHSISDHPPTSRCTALQADAEIPRRRIWGGAASSVIRHRRHGNLRWRRVPWRHKRHEAGWFITRNRLFVKNDVPYLLAVMSLLVLCQPRAATDLCSPHSIREANAVFVYQPPPTEQIKKGVMF